ncbi:MAG TPA: AAA family ATPase [Acidimicrobiales bacterium]
MPFRLRRLVFNSGDEVDVADADVVVLVGPNNSGKSRVLRETLMALSLQRQESLLPDHAYVLRDVDVSVQLSADELRVWLEENRQTRIDEHQMRVVRTLNGPDHRMDHLLSSWQHARFGLLAEHLVRGLFCESRLNHLRSPARPNPGDPVDDPMQLVATSPQLLEKLRAAFYAAFKEQLILDAWGPYVLLRVTRDYCQSDFATQSDHGLAPREVVDRLVGLPTIEWQSDGVRSFAGVMLRLLTERFPLTLLDEPEAFLHPPQARLLGRYLSSFSDDGQLVVATHSLDVLLGLIEGGHGRVVIVRLSRERGVTSARVLPPERLKEIWSDPLLRFSRALDGLFHEAVVVCEGDTDSSFYSAVATKNPATDGDLTRPDVMFTFAGSKHRLPLVTGALVALGVPVAAVADFDVLNDERVLSNVVRGLGATYTKTMERWRRVLDSGLRGSDAAITLTGLREGIAALLGDERGPGVNASTVRRVKELLEPHKGWRGAKKSGMAVVPHGDATVAAEELLTEMRNVGLFVVRSGAVESFVRAVPSTGSRWVVEVVEGGHLERATDAATFVADVLAHLTRTD